MASANNDAAAPIKADVIIIGAGQAGMAAAHALLKQGHEEIHVLEAHVHVGGRTRNYDVKTNEYDTATEDAIELGGTWISPDHTAFLEQCRELGITVFRASFAKPANENERTDDEMDEWPWWYWGMDYTEEEEAKTAKKTIFHHVTDDKHTKFSFCTPKELLTQMNQDTLHELEQVGDMLDDTAAQFNDLSWETVKPSGHWNEIDSMSTSAKLMSRLKTNDARNTLRNVIHNKNAQEPEQVSFLYNMLSFKGCNSSGADGEYRICGGTQAVPLAIAKMLGSKRLTCGDPVQSVRIMESPSSKDTLCTRPIQVVTKSGKVFASKALIVTGSPPAILHIDFDPPLPSIHAQLLQRMPMGTSRKFIAIYKRGPWWRKFGFTGDILASGLPKELSVSVEGSGGEELVPIFGQCFDTSPYSQEYGVLTCFIEGRQNLYFSNLGEEQQRSLMRQYLQLTFQDVTDFDEWEPDCYVTHNWADDPYVRGAYTAYLPPGVLSVPEWWEAYREMEKLPNVFLAGADYHVGFGNGYMEGAVRSGQRAAELVHERLTKV